MVEVPKRVCLWLLLRERIDQMKNGLSWKRARAFTSSALFRRWKKTQSCTIHSIFAASLFSFLLLLLFLQCSRSSLRSFGRFMFSIVKTFQLFLPLFLPLLSKIVNLATLLLITLSRKSELSQRSGYLTRLEWHRSRLLSTDEPLLLIQLVAPSFCSFFAKKSSSHWNSAKRQSEVFFTRQQQQRDFLFHFRLFLLFLLPHLLLLLRWLSDPFALRPTRTRPTGAHTRLASREEISCKAAAHRPRPTRPRFPDCSLVQKFATVVVVVAVVVVVGHKWVKSCIGLNSERNVKSLEHRLTAFEMKICLFCFSEEANFKSLKQRLDFCFWP